MTGHFHRLIEVKQVEQRRRDVRENPALDFEIFSVLSNINNMNKICRVRGIGRPVAIGICSQLP